MENEKVYDVKFENIDKCIGRIDNQLEKHEGRIRDLEEDNTKIFERLGGLIKVLWVVAAAIMTTIVYAFMQLILK